ncbi:cobalamin-dependent protein, partial [Patescibacteria group bacterium]|nr:cobalamin-dependent protein [Patescibacteria group bacterium]
MKKVLLINPPFNITKSNYDTSLSVGLLNIASYLDSRGVAVEIIDGARQSNYLERLKSEIPNCSLAALAVMTMQVGQALKVSQMIRELNPDCQIIWGGPHPTFFPEQTIKNNLIDIVCVGEGEETILEVASGQAKLGQSPAERGGKYLKTIDGIVYKDGGQIIANKSRVLHDPVKMPLFNWDLVPREILERLALIPSLTSRGCPHRCTFCINAILKNSWRPRSAEQVLEDLRIIKSKLYFVGKPLRFWDENFFVDIARAKKIINGMIAQNLVIPWETTVRANYLRDGMIDDAFMAKL